MNAASEGLLHFFAPLLLTRGAKNAILQKVTKRLQNYKLVTRTGVSQMAEATEGLVYRGHPLRRVDNLIYYGSMADKYIVLLQILDTVKEQDMDVAKRVSVQLQLTDPDLKSRDRVVKKSEKDSLYAAMDVGCIWLERALAGKL